MTDAAEGLCIELNIVAIHPGTAICRDRPPHSAADTQTTIESTGHPATAPARE